MKLYFILVGLVLILLNNVSAFDDYFCFTKLKNNEFIPSVVNSISDKLICANGKCICKLDSGDGYCLVCTNSSGWFSSYTNCNSDFCDSEEVINGPLDLNVKFPFLDNSIIKNQRFFIEIDTSRKSKIDLINNLKSEKKNLCMHCNYFKKMVFFNEGFNNITIKSAVAGEVKQHTIRFFIDTKKPKILKVFPVQNGFSDGNFTISYDENNIKSIELFYGESDDIHSVALDNCESGKNSCSIQLDFEGYSWKKAVYWFSIKDIADNIVNSSKLRIFVDNKDPIINSIDYTLNEDEYNIKLNVSEDNFQKAIYIDDSGKEKLFCSSLSRGFCSRKLKLFGNILIRVIDRAGNYEEREFIIS